MLKWWLNGCLKHFIHEFLHLIFWARIIKLHHVSTQADHNHICLITRYSMFIRPELNENTKHKSYIFPLNSLTNRFSFSAYCDQQLLCAVQLSNTSMLILRKHILTSSLVDKCLLRWNFGFIKTMTLLLRLFLHFKS